MKFKYKKFGQSLRPVIEIRIKNKNEFLRYEVLIDSGADMCIFDAEIGKAIGVDVEKGKKCELFGVAGKASIYFLCPVQIEVGGWTYDIEAGFMPEVSGRFFSYGIVGQKGFFENFIVKFDLLKEEVELKNREK